MKGRQNYFKGLVFEQKFSIYMISELKYDSVKRRKSMTGSESIKGSEADIIGIIYNRKAESIRKAGIFFMIIAIISLIGVAFELIHKDFIYFFLLFGISGFVYGIIGKKKSRQYTWVECKDRTKTTDIRMVRDFYNSVQDFNNSKDKKYSISKMIFVSASGFVDNALQFASDKRIECYRLIDNSFQKIKY